MYLDIWNAGGKIFTTLWAASSRWDLPYSIPSILQSSETGWSAGLAPLATNSRVSQLMNHHSPHAHANTGTHPQQNIRNNGEIESRSLVLLEVCLLVKKECLISSWGSDCFWTKDWLGAANERPEQTLLAKMLTGHSLYHSWEKIWHR